MKVMKFGGASVKNADGVRNVADIIRDFCEDDLCVVVSAMGKTTNALEQVVNDYFSNPQNVASSLSRVRQYHHEIISSLFPENSHPVYDEVSNFFAELEWVLEEPMNHGYDHTYDQIVSVGELISSCILCHFLNANVGGFTWIDIRDILITDSRYRNARLNWKDSGNRFESFINGRKGKKLLVTQGFIGCTDDNQTTTLGREGSDYTAAILATFAGAPELIIWKDVPGVLSADPRKFSDARLLPHLSYHDAIELTYYGATVIHPKTIQPLQASNIPLRVKSFTDKSLPGTIIDGQSDNFHIPCLIHKDRQLLLTISVKDFAFIVEENLSAIFAILARFGVRVNLMQNSAISFSVCIDDDERIRMQLIDELRKEFKVLYNEDLELLTVRYYQSGTIDAHTLGRAVLLEQRSRNTFQAVMKPR
jgi:aspartate kinase